MDARDVTVWQLVDERIAELRRIPFDALSEMASAPQSEELDRGGVRYRRRTRVLPLGDDRLGLKVAVDADGRRPKAERCVILAPEGRLAPEWTLDEPDRNIFAAGPKVTVAGILIAVLLFTVFLLLV